MRLVKFGIITAFCAVFALICGINIPVFAQDVPVPELEKAYILESVEAPGDGIITKFEMVDAKLVPKYYKVVLSKTEYGDPTGNSTKHYEWSKDANGNNQFSEVATPTEGKQTITVKYDSATNPRLENTGTSGADINGNFVGQKKNNTNENTYGGAIYNGRNAKIGNITGDFVGNYVSSSSSDYSNGGAIYNVGTIEDITGDFVGNNASNSKSSYGGAINNCQNAKIGNITGDFVGNYASSFFSYGGAIYNIGTIGNITGDFVGNYASSSNSSNGGAIYNDNIGTIGNITGDFVGNYASSSNSSNSSSSKGGAIYNFGTIGNITGDFVGNYASNSDYYSNGGAIYNDRTIGDITGDFVGNYASSSNSDYSSSRGGAICNDRTIGDITGDFVGNYASSSNSSNSSASKGGAINNSGTIGDITGDFFGNYISSSNSRGGAINNFGMIGAKDADGKVVGGIINSIFINNYAKAESTNSSATALGGAIYTSNNLNIIADNGTSLFSGNKTITTINKGTENETTVEDQNAIYVDSNSATLTLNSKNNGIIQFDDKIDGKKGYNLNLTGDTTGKILLNNSVDNANVTSENITLNLGKNDIFKNSDFTINSGSLSLINNTAEQQIMQSANINGNINLAVDVNLANQTMDTLSDNTTLSNNAKIGVNYINLLNDATKNITEIQFAPEDYAQAVSYTGANPIAYTPIYKYDVSYNPDNGMFIFTGGPGGSTPNNPDNYNPAVLPTPVTSQTGAYTTQLQTISHAFNHSDSFMNIPALDRMAIKNQNKYALSPTGDATDVGVFSPLFTKTESAGFWFKPYASFESVPLNNGPKVSNINYGTLVGFDSSLKSIAKGFDRVITGYIAYNGASQRYSGVDSYQNGGILGSTLTLYKGNFFNATTTSIGASAGQNTTMYGNENYTMLLTGIANKTGYNFEFLQGKIILQPSMLIAYTFVNTFDYTNAAGLRIESDPLNAIQLAPGIKLIGNLKNGWQPYLGVNMIWNLLDKTKVTANDVRLPEMSIDPYVEYGVGVQKRFGERFTGFVQTMLRNGGRNGVSLTAGLKWTI